MSSGNNRSKLSKHAAAVLGSGRFSGRSMGIKTSAGAPPSKSGRRKSWYQGLPNKAVGTSAERGSMWGTRSIPKNPDGRPAQL